MSNGFAGNTTKTLYEIERELENRYEKSMSKKRLDVFTDDFNPPGAVEHVPGGNYKKRGDTGIKHEDSVPEADKSFTLAAGKAEEQEPMDVMDADEYRKEVGIKKYGEQFPGSLLSIGKKVEKRLSTSNLESKIKAEGIAYRDYTEKSDVSFVVINEGHLKKARHLLRKEGYNLVSETYSSAKGGWELTGRKT